MDLLETARKENIHVFALPPHTTHKLQPLDKCVFGPFKKYYGAACTEFLSEHPANVVSKVTWTKLFATAWNLAFCSGTIKKAFQATGIHPFDPSVVTRRDTLPSEAFDRPAPPTPVASDRQVTGIHPFDPIVVSTLPSPAPTLPVASVHQTIACDSLFELAFAPSAPEATVVTEVVQNTDPCWPPTDNQSEYARNVPPSESFSDILQLAMEISGIEGEGQAFANVEAEYEDKRVVDERWLVELSAIFDKPTLPPVEKKGTSRKISTHRLLTSDQVIEIKQRQAEEKKSKLIEKKRRADVRQEKAAKRNKN